MKDNELTKKIEKMLHDQFTYHDAAWVEMASIVQTMVEDDILEKVIQSVKDNCDVKTIEFMYVDEDVVVLEEVIKAIKRVAKE